jgi:hypothetical protein
MVTQIQLFESPDLDLDLDLDLAGGEGPSGPDTPRPYRQTLCVPFNSN